MSRGLHGCAAESRRSHGDYAGVAIHGALNDPLHRDPLRAEWAEELSHFLVDVVRDENHAQSRSFRNWDKPLLELLETWCKWAAHPAVPTTSQALIDPSPRRSRRPGLTSVVSHSSAFIRPFPKELPLAQHPSPDTSDAGPAR